MFVRYWRGDGKPLTIRIDNTLDQQISVQVMANRLKSAVAATLPVTVGAAFVVASAASEMVTISPDVEGWFPNVYLTITASVAPASGSVSAYAEGEGVLP